MKLKNSDGVMYTTDSTPTKIYKSPFLFPNIYFNVRLW